MTREVRGPSTPDAAGKAHCNPSRSTRRTSPRGSHCRITSTAGRPRLQPEPRSGSSWSRRRLTTRTCLTTTSTSRPRCATSTSSTGHRNRRALTARAAGASTPRPGEPRHPTGWRHALEHDVRTTDRLPLPRATVPRGERRHVPRPPPAHCLRHRHRAAARHEAIVAGGETGPMARALRRASLIKAGPTGGATMQQVALSGSFVL